MNWLHYLFEANLYLCIFYLLYRLLLSHETHYALSRGYLLLASIVSFIIPVMQLGVLRPVTQVPIEPVNHGLVSYATSTTVQMAQVQTPGFTLNDGLVYVYAIGAAVFLLLLLVKLVRLSLLGRSGNKSKKNGYQVVEIDGSATAFSFFNKLYIGTDIVEKETIIRHELVHIRQKHSADITLMEVMRVFCWFNPVVYLLQNSLKAIHEYIADEKASASESSRLAYSSFLVNNAYGIAGPAVAQSFYNKNLLKNRIMMLNKKPSGNLARLKYLLMLPLVALLLGVSTLAFSKSYGWLDILPAKFAKPIKILPPVVQQADTPRFKKVVQFATPNPLGAVTSKGYHYAESGYLIDGKSYFRVIIQDEKGLQHEYWKDKASEQEIRMLKDKYDYTFPTIELFSKRPPPPPAPPKPVRIPNPKVVVKIQPPAIVKVDTLAAPAKPAQPPQPAGVQAPPPPMEPFIAPSEPFAVLGKYLGKHTLYPATAFENRTTGSVIMKFDITADHKIANVSLVKGFASACDEEALSVLKGYNEAIDKAPGTYKIAVTYYIHGGNAPKPASSTLYNDPGFIGEVIIEGYPK